MFSYGYHFCSNSKINCARLQISGKKPTIEMAIKELKETREQIDQMIKEADSRIQTK